MATTLDNILARTQITVAERKQTADLAKMEQQAAAHTPRGFAAALRQAAIDGPAVIAELKKASPSRGIIREDFQPALLARSLAEAGAATLSVLTDEPFFQGSLAYLTEASGAVRIPILRKDFMIDPFQMLEARAAGADAILLIVAAHTDDTLRMLTEEAHRLELDVLCEVHDAEELKRAADLGADLLGVNSRDLKTLQVHPNVHAELVAQMPVGVVRVAESGLNRPEDVEALSRLGYDAFLIGEALMRQADPGAALSSMLRTRFAGEL